MAALLDSSHEFSSLVKQLHVSPDNPALKQAVVRYLPEMMALAKVNPVALYRLAQIHSPTSPQYKQMMRQAATMGCTNAMLAISELLVKSHSPVDLKTAAHYLTMIERSKDSYMIKQSRTLLDSHPEVASLMKAEFKADSYNTGIRFFNKQAEARVQPEYEMENSPAI